MTNNQELDEKAEGEAAALVTVAPRRQVGSREVSSRGGRESACRLRAHDRLGKGVREARLKGAFALADAAATDEQLDKKAEGDAAALVTVVPRRWVDSREVGSCGGRESARGLRARA